MLLASLLEYLNFFNFAEFFQNPWVTAGINDLFIWALIVTVQYWRLARASVKWPSVDGTMQECKLDFNQNRGTKTYYAKVKYTYLVKNRTYVSRVKGYHLYSMGAEAFGLDHPPGKIVTVYYNPANPKQATLETGTSIANYLAILCVAVAVTVCFLLL